MRWFLITRSQSPSLLLNLEFHRQSNLDLISIRQDTHKWWSLLQINQTSWIFCTYWISFYESAILLMWKIKRMKNQQAAPDSKTNTHSFSLNSDMIPRSQETSSRQTANVCRISSRKQDIVHVIMMFCSSSPRILIGMG